MSQRWRDWKPSVTGSGGDLCALARLLHACWRAQLCQGLAPAAHTIPPANAGVSTWVAAAVLLPMMLGDSHSWGSRLTAGLKRRAGDTLPLWQKSQEEREAHRNRLGVVP